MSATVGWTQDDIDTLKAAIASGIMTVSYAGPPARSIMYQSLGQMRDLLASMVAEVAAASGNPTTRYATTSKGFDCE